MKKVPHNVALSMSSLKGMVAAFVVRIHMTKMMRKQIRFMIPSMIEWTSGVKYTEHFDCKRK